MRLKNKKHKHFITHRQQKIPRTKPQKRKNKQQPFIVVFLSHSRPLYSSHTTHHPTHNTQQKALPTRGDLQNNTRAALDTQQHATKQNKPSQTKHKHTCYSAKPLQPVNQLKKPRFVSSTPKTTHMKYVRYLSSPENKNLPPLRAQTRHQTMTKTCHHQVLTSTHTVTKQILYSP